MHAFVCATRGWICGSTSYGNTLWNFGTWMSTVALVMVTIGAQPLFAVLLLLRMSCFQPLPASPRSYVRLNAMRNCAT
jgi:hypothetical protein